MSSNALPLLMLPGMMCDERLFHHQQEALSQERDVLVGDISGHSSMSAIAQGVLQAAPVRFALAGVSMGGIVAMEMLRIAPTRIAGVALMDTNPLAELDAVKQGREPQIKAALAGQLDTVMRDEMKPRYLAAGTHKQDILTLCMRMAMDMGAAVFERQSRALQRRRDQQDVLCQIDVPALVLMGAEDTLCPLDRHELMAQLIPNATLEIIEGAGHLPTLEQPQATNCALTNWLRNL